MKPSPFFRRTELKSSRARIRHADRGHVVTEGQALEISSQKHRLISDRPQYVGSPGAGTVSTGGQITRRQRASAAAAARAADSFPGAED
ncbi:hypothetical protein FKM82_010410 [Ascaphus truei]